jgi:hypothetical protein
MSAQSILTSTVILCVRSYWLVSWSSYPSPPMINSQISSPNLYSLSRLVFY